MYMGRRKNLVHEKIKIHEKMETDKITHQQDLFCQQVASGKNQSESYRIAYPKSLKWKESTVWERASVQMRNNKVITRINELKEKNQTRNEVKLDEVLENLAKYLRFNIKSIVNSNGTLKSFDDMTDDEAACIQSFECTEIYKGSGEDRQAIGTLKRVKLVDKLGTADKFLRNMGAYINNRNHRFDKENLDHLKEILDSIE
jgi:phage terminase small subunit